MTETIPERGVATPTEAVVVVDARGDISCCESVGLLVGTSER